MYAHRSHSIRQAKGVVPRRHVAGGWLLVATLAACESAEPVGPTNRPPPPLPGQPLAAQVTIDGVVDLSELPVIRSTEVEFRDALGGGPLSGTTTTVEWGTLNDERDLYVAFVWDDPVPDSDWSFAAGPVQSDGIVLAFDDDGDGTIELGEDQRALLGVFDASQFVDQHAGAAGTAPDVVGDGVGRMRYDAANNRWGAEFLIPMEEDAENEDGPKSSSTRIAFQLFDAARLSEGTGGLGSPFGAFALGTSTQGWPTLELTNETTVPPLSLPPLAGLIVFLSEHEGTQEIYTYDPGTGVQSLVPTPAGLFKDAVSLSHDRTRIAFHGAPSPSDYAAYEIYTVGVDGSGFRQLTNNGLLDGHPAWSPDDARLAYASFRDGGRASIVLMDTDGVEIADLTPDGIDDNDPEFAPDGRIIIKTTRFSPHPLYRMAVMNDDGSGVVELTSVAGVSDHDGVSDGERVFFERFTKNTEFSNDPEAFFTSWDVVSVGLDGNGETTLVTDGWVNWLPVPDPSGEYLVYLKNVGYTEARLLDVAGNDFGRLIPGVTRIGYLDWK